MAATTTNVCEVKNLYNDNFNYSLPQNILEGFLSGIAFNNKEPYTQQELDNLRKDINSLYEKILGDNPIRKKEAVITAGAPGSGKTTLLKKELAGRKYAYVCPDDVCLTGQLRTYQADKAQFQKTEKPEDAALKSYNKWRPGSNAATHLILGNLIQQGYAFYFGSTSSGPATGKSFDFLKKQGYNIRIIHLMAPDDVRWESVKKRDQTFLQVTKKDVREKGLLLPQRIEDTFLAYADEIDFFLRDGVDQDADLAAKWTKNKEGSSSLGTLEVYNPNQYGRIKAIHNEAIKALQKPELSWESTVERKSVIVNK